MKTAISLPDTLFEAAEQAARRAGMSRSELYRTALIEFLERHGDAGVTAALDAAYSSESSTVDPVLARMQGASLARDDW